MLVEQHITRWFLPLAKAAESFLPKGVDNYQSYRPQGLTLSVLDTETTYEFFKHFYLPPVSHRRL